jgi:hypothetical protein
MRVFVQLRRELSDGPVTCSLGIFNKHQANYAQARQNLIDHISRYSHTKGLDSVWFIQATSTAVALPESHDSTSC